MAKLYPHRYHAEDAWLASVSLLTEPPPDNQRRIVGDGLLLVIESTGEQVLYARGEGINRWLRIVTLSDLDDMTEFGLQVVNMVTELREKNA